MPEAEGTNEQQAEKSEEQSGKEAEQFKPITSQEDLNRVIGERVKRAKPSDYDDLKAKAAKFDEIEQANKTELQKITEDRDTHQKRGDTAEQQVARLEVALTKGLTLTQAKRLVGKTREEFEADADELLADLGKSGKQSPKPNPAQGRDEGTTGTGDWLRDQLSRR